MYFCSTYQAKLGACAKIHADGVLVTQKISKISLANTCTRTSKFALY